MGRLSGTETALALVVAFIEKDTWTQADLARRLDVGVAALRKRLHELIEAGVPLEREEDAPHVYWSVPKNWIPSGVRLDPSDVAELLRLLARLPSSALRNRLASRVLQGTAHARPRTTEPPPAVLVPALDPHEERWLSIVEDTSRASEVLSLNYLSTSGGGMQRRQVSPHRVVVGPPARFLATCHRDGELKWFRVDRILRADSAGKTDYRTRSTDELDDAVRFSVNGFRSGGALTRVAFHVRDPEARWVQGNLPQPLTSDPVRGGIRVHGETAAVIQVARFVVGLGGAAVPETPELRAVVRDLAEAALTSLEGTAQKTSREDRALVDATTSGEAE